MLLEVGNEVVAKAAQEDRLGGLEVKGVQTLSCWLSLIKMETVNSMKKNAML